jgi:SpoVK/Ycf46/Vps4 family AAA+-type ATPase
MTYENSMQGCVINESEIDVNLNDIGGLSDIKEDIRLTVVLPLQYPELFFNSSMKHLNFSRGVLLHGPPGTGKTMLAKAIAKESHATFLSLTASRLENKWYGETNKLLAGAFSFAKKHQPCIIFMDEVDGLGRQRSEFDSGGSYNLKTELLQHMDGISTSTADQILVVACTNNITSLDPALKRRFSKQLRIDLPNAKERYAILELLCKEEHCKTNDLWSVVNWTHGFSGSQLKDLYQKVSAYRLKSDLIKLSKHKINCDEFVSKIKPLKITHWKRVLNVGHNEAPPPID